MKPIRFDEEVLRRLEALRLAVRRRVRGRREGERPTARRGGAGEFHSHREYSPGDDLRGIDWNLYARLGALFLRERGREETPVIDLFVDTSASMGFGKMELSVTLAAAIGAVAFAESAEVRLQGERSHASLPSLLGDLSSFAPEGRCRFAEQLESCRRPGSPRFFLSDFWETELRTPILRATEGGETAILHVLSAEETEPTLEGRVKFVDAETGGTCLRYVGEEERIRYRRMLQEHREEWRIWASGHRIRYAHCRADDRPWEEVVIVALRESGVVE